MDSYYALKIRGILRIICCVFAGCATVIASIFRAMMKTKALEATGLCMASRICAIVMFVTAVGAAAMAYVARSFSSKSDGSIAIMALIGFIGNFLVRPASTKAMLMVFQVNHIIKGTFLYNTTQLRIGAYMIILSGLATVSYTVRAIKSGD